MTWDRIGYEIRLLWKMVMLPPILIIGIVGIFALLQNLLHNDATRVFITIPEMFLPVAAGIIISNILAQDKALELHLTTIHTYTSTAILRLVLLFGWSALLSIVIINIMLLTHHFYLPRFTQSWSTPLQVLIVQIVWLVPLIWFIAAGLCIGLTTRSRSAASALVGGIWLLELLFLSVFTTTAWLQPFLLFPTSLVIYPAIDIPPATFNTYWLITRLELFAMSLVLLPLSWLLLRNTESLLKGASEE